MSRTHKDRKQEIDFQSETGWHLYRMYAGARLWRFCRHWWKSERRKVKVQLEKGEEPDPTRTRSSIKWDMF